MIEAGLLQLDNALVVRGLWKNVMKLVWDGDVDGMAWPVCNASCRANDYDLPLLMGWHYLLAMQRSLHGVGTVAHHARNV